MIYARQINPEYQESPLFFGDEFFPDNIAVFGNRDYKEHVPGVVERVRKELDNGTLAEYLDEFAAYRYGETTYKNRTEAIMDYLPPEHKEKYSTKEIHELCRICAEYGNYGGAAYDVLLRDALDIVTGKKWDFRYIRGCCQSDWNKVFYPVDEWTPEALDAFECEYFNTGTEWIVHDEDGTPEDPEDINGFSVYCHGWRDEDIRKEIADAYGADDEVTLYKWAGKRYYDVYEKVV